MKVRNEDGRMRLMRAIGVMSMLLVSLSDARSAEEGWSGASRSIGPVEADAGHDESAMKAAAATAVLMLSSSSNMLVLPSQVTLTATVSGGALKGNVTFKSAGNTVGTATINKSAAVLTLALPAAIHSLTAVFPSTSGDVVSAPVIVVVDNALTCS